MKDEQRSKMKKIANAMYDEFSDPDMANSENIDERIGDIIVSYSCIASVVAFLPPYLIPGADFWAISFIQVMMGLKIAEEYGIQANRESLGHVLKTFGIGFGMGWIAQNAVLTAYRFIIPHWGAITTFTMVFSASFVIGMVFKRYFYNQTQGIENSKSEIKSVMKEAFSEGKEVASEFKSRIDFDKMKAKIKDLFQSGEQTKSELEDDDDENKAS